jgi:hypothetical protein
MFGETEFLRDGSRCFQFPFVALTIAEGEPVEHEAVGIEQIGQCRAVQSTRQENDSAL